MADPVTVVLFVGGLLVISVLRVLVLLGMLRSSRRLRNGGHPHS
jgi:hypothetical protein